MRFLDPSGCYEVSRDCYETYTQGQYYAINTNIYAYLREMIMTIRFDPGEKLVESAIAEKLNVSRSPVKQAIQQLVEEGLVVRQSSKTAIVAPIEYNDCLMLMNARKGIEGQGAYEAAKQITDEELNALKSFLLRLKKPADYPMEEYARIHSAFNMTIMKASRNHYLLDAYKKIDSAMFRYNLYIFKQWSLQNFREYNHHFPIYHALKNHSSAQAKLETLAAIEGMVAGLFFLLPHTEI